MKSHSYLSFLILICIAFVQAEDATTDVTTILPVTTTAAPSPPTPDEGSWNVTEGNKTCIRAEFKIRFKIPIENETEYLVLYPNATTTGSSCNISDVYQSLVLIDKDFVLTFLFEDMDSSSYRLRNLTLVMGEQEYSNGPLFSVKNGHSYMCKATRPLILMNSDKNVTMETLFSHVQAFSGTENEFGIAEECDADDKVNDVVPIAVACALAALIIIVLIAYLIGRRRSRQKGYNSV